MGETNGMPVYEFGAVAVLGTAFLLLIRWMIHQMSRQLADVSSAIRTQALVQLDMHKTLLIHDAQIRGVNLAPGETATDAHKKAYDEYKKLLATLDGTSETIKATLTYSAANCPPPKFLIWFLSASFFQC